LESEISVENHVGGTGFQPVLMMPNDPKFQISNFLDFFCPKNTWAGRPCYGAQ